MAETKNLRKENSSQTRQLAKTHHETLWLGSRFLEKDERNLVEAVLAFDGELLKIASAVSESMIGQIRYQWWRDKLTENHSNMSRSYTDKLEPVQALIEGLGNGVTELLTQMIDAREDVFLQDAPVWKGNEALFLLLSGVVTDSKITPECAQELGKLYAFADGTQEQTIAFPEIPVLTGLLQAGQSDDWPILCAFSLMSYWMRKQRLSPFRKRWLIWKGFLSGEKALLKILSDTGHASSVSL